ncbi:MAG: peptide chain release factor N(5)-glutamine methyltransferase [Candidatus Pedobacter colombiensis]|uniref:peptide chain release factor N(5)-glutamine methyltransferase n=1 Tax=Candidatus Pedobacter colombiensis TaxID=3121371 RepID=A0AAJ5WF88_9SPHI|nr:peptide chain release factor N(5)-glutamine methyltransferase [Pedobacter sp.]WEK21477.1 MAG: peptide chain release factor N(5)-glutamine methyltransferase [Pedobacter sp.]
MNLKELLQHFTIELQDIYGAEEVSSIFYITTDHISGFSRAVTILKGAELLSEQQESAYLKVLARLKTGKPIQYILEETVFYGLPFKVTPAVLIPRPETEELVEWVIESSALAEVTGSSLRIIDIGTGSGCIAVSLKKYLPLSEVSALDVSKEAIEVASGNASLNQVDVNFIEADIREFSTRQKFDVIVSNPPYITEKEEEQMHHNVLDHEPHMALFVPNEKPLLFYEAIADFASVSLSDMGLLFFEINEHYGKEMIDMLRSKSFINIELKKDMQGKDRMIKCQRAIAL